MTSVEHGCWHIFHADMSIRAQKRYRTYRTKDAILRIFDELQTLGLNRLLEYQSHVPGGPVAAGWTPS